MGDTKNASVQIGELNLRIPGGSADFGHRVSAVISKQLGKRLGVGPDQRIGVLNMHVQLANGNTETEAGDAIANSIVNALKSGSRKTVISRLKRR